MNLPFSKNQLALAVAAAVGVGALVAGPSASMAAKPAGQYQAGDVHNHTTCSDGSISMQKLVSKATTTPWSLDWFVQAGHGGAGNRNCTLAEDASLDEGPYPFNPSQGPNTTWAASGATTKGTGLGTTGNMWRWQAIQEYQYPLMEYLNAAKNKPLFSGLETINSGHEHTSMSVITGQIPVELDTTPLDTTPPYNPVGNATALAQWIYCFEGTDNDTSRGAGQNWDCSVPGSNSSSDPNWNATAHKLTGNTGTVGHLKNVEAVKWIAATYPGAGYFLPTHLERAGPFNPNGNNGFNVEHLRDFNNAAPSVAFGFESQPGHGASANRGEYQVRRQTINGVPTDSVGGTTYGGTGVYAGIVGGVWDALLGEGRNWWFFASSDWHNRGTATAGNGATFSADDRRTAQDFYPGEYQRSYTMVRQATGKLRPQAIVDGMRSGNIWSTQGQLIDRLAFVACASYAGFGTRTNAQVEAIALAAAAGNTDTDSSGCATMGEKLKVRTNAEIVVSVVVRDPAGSNVSPYTFENPSLLQSLIHQPINQPVLDHVDLVRGLVTGYRTPGAANYSGTWPLNLDWLHADGTIPTNAAGNPDLTNVPDAAKNTSAAVIKTFNSTGWTSVVGTDGTAYLKMTYRIPPVTASQYVRLRGTNMPPSIPFETDANGNPLPDVHTNANEVARLRIPCDVPHSAGNQFDGCPDHLPVPTSGPLSGHKAVAYDIAAWSDLWFYSNPIYVEVAGSQVIQGVQ